MKSKGSVNLQKPLFLICVFKINLINKRKTESIPPCRRSLAMLGEDTFGKRNPLNSCNKYSDLIKCSKSDCGGFELRHEHCLRHRPEQSQQWGSHVVELVDGRESFRKRVGVS